MTYALSPGWRLCGIVSCPDSFLPASSGISAGYRTGILALLPHHRGRLACRLSSPSLTYISYARRCVQIFLHPVHALLRPESHSEQRRSATPSPQRTCEAGSSLSLVRNFAAIFPSTQRKAKAEGEPKSLWQASSAPRCPAFAWPEACEGQPSRILSSSENTTVLGMRRLHSARRRIAGRTGSF